MHALLKKCIKYAEYTYGCYRLDYWITYCATCVLSNRWSAVHSIDTQIRQMEQCDIVGVHAERRMLPTHGRKNNNQTQRTQSSVDADTWLPTVILHQECD